jgi:hypothetical protein
MQELLSMLETETALLAASCQDRKELEVNLATSSFELSELETRLEEVIYSN